MKKTTGNNGKSQGLLAEFDTPEDLKAAARRLREAGYTQWEAYSPFPVHGLDEAMGASRPPLQLLTIGCGAAGALAGILMQWWMVAVDYPFNLSGKLPLSLPAFIPVAFETTILFAALGAFFGMLFFAGLPRLYHALHTSPRFQRATSDRFLLNVCASDPKYDPEKTAKLLEEAGGTGIETVFDDGSGQMPQWLAPVIILLAAVSITMLAFAYRDRTSPTTLTRIDLIPDMDNQRKFRAQTLNLAFEDGRAMRPEVRGALAVEHFSDDKQFSEGIDGATWTTTMPMQVDMNLMKRGKERFGIYCAPCHGLAGDGNGMIARRATSLEEGTWVPPADFHTQRIREMPAGQIYHTITFGVRKMPPYGAQIPPRDRWAIIAYVRALQRSQNATLDDVPEDKKELFRQ